MNHLYTATFGQYDRNLKAVAVWGTPVSIVAKNMPQALQLALRECPDKMDVVSIKLTTSNVVVPA